MSTVPLAAALTYLRTEMTPRDAARSDRELLHDYAATSDQLAFTALVRRHGPMVQAVCRRVLRHHQDAEDAFQAVFLVLARGAATIRKGDSLTSWLHGVSYRVAMRAKRDAGRRRKHEGQAEPRPAPPAWETAWHELQAIIDEEVEQLPPAFRDAFLLCCLEGLSKPEAAVRLGVKENTVSSRLARARKWMQERLARRGISLASVLAALAVSGIGRARVAAQLAHKAATAAPLGAGVPVAGFSLKALYLAEGVTRTMLPNKVKLATVLLVALCALATGLGVFARSGEQKPPAAATAQPAATPAPTASKDTTITVSGQVLDPEGKPAPGAKLYLLDFAQRKTPPPLRATTALDGSFRFTFTASEVKMPPYGKAWNKIMVVATAEGFGPALAAVEKPEPALKRTLRLVKDDVPVRGRVIDLEGRPVAAARTVVFRLMVPKSADLGAFLKDLEGREDGYPAEYGQLTVLEHPGLAAFFPVVSAGKDGRFELRGIGRERVVGLTISGPSIETQQVRVRTRAGATIRRLEWRDGLSKDKLTYHGAAFDHAVGPTRVVSGVVRDKGTGKPLAGATVESVMLAGSRFYGHTFIRTRTDQEGHYRLVGLPAGAGNLIRAVPPPDRPYLSVERSVPAPIGLAAVSIDFELKAGVWIEGKVLDKVTGKAVEGEVEYFAFRDNPHLKDIPGLAIHHRGRTAEDGSFRFLSIHGRGLVAVRAHGDGYVVGVGAESYQKGPIGHILGTSPGCLATGFHTLVEIEPKAGAQTARCEVALDPGLRPTGTVLGPDGKPLAGARACGLTSYAFTYWGNRLETAQFQVLGLSKKHPRGLLFLHEGKKLAGSLLLRGDEKGPLTVKLQPWGVIRGRVVGPDGLPRAKVELTLSRYGNRLFDPTCADHPTREFFTDKDGKFQVEGLIPGVKSTMSELKNGGIAGRLFTDRTVKAGETTDLGDVQVGD
jgi:RNA polymerase sigma factor (sigma-70 family)